jgi:hypothetical protein
VIPTEQHAPLCPTIENRHQRLIERLAQQDPFYRVQGAPPPDPPIHLRQRVVALEDAK